MVYVVVVAREPTAEEANTVSAFADKGLVSRLTKKKKKRNVIYAHKKNPRVQRIAEVLCVYIPKEKNINGEWNFKVNPRTRG